MKTTCPYSHVSYARWRSQVLGRLIADVGENPPRLSFLYPIYHHARQFHASPTHTRNVKKDIRRTAIHRVRKAEEASASPTGHSTPATSTFSPFVGENVDDLKDLVGNLQQLAREAKVEEDTEESGILFQYGTHIYWRKNPDQPESPLERSLPSNRPAKLRVDEGEVDKTLRDNVWAQVLASPIRLDKGTKSRLPRDLMITWGMLSNPKDEQNYLLPIELSDLEALKQELQATDSDAQDALNEQEPNSTLEKSSDFSGKRFHIASNRSLIQTMTDHFTVLRRKPGSREQVQQIDSKRLGSLVPIRWRNKYNETEAFAQTQERYNEILQRDPDIDEPRMDDLANLNALKWQLDIASRMENIMQQRVLMALDAVGQSNVSGQAFRDKRVFALPLPKNGEFIQDAQGRLVEELSTPDEPAVSDWLHGAMFLYIGDTTSYKNTIEQWHQYHTTQDTTSQLPPSPTDNLFPPTITINSHYRLPLFNLPSLFNQTNTSNLTTTLAQNHNFNLNFWQERSRMKFHDANNEIVTKTPVSPASAGEEVLNAIITPSASPSISNSDSDLTSEPPTATEPYLVLIKPRARHSSLLIREIWQLWRFVGGRAGLDFQ